MREGLTNFGEASGQNWLADGLVSQAWQVWLKLCELLHCSSLQQHEHLTSSSSSMFQAVSCGLQSLDC